MLHCHMQNAAPIVWFFTAASYAMPVNSAAYLVGTLPVIGLIII